MLKGAPLGIKIILVLYVIESLLSIWQLLNGNAELIRLGSTLLSQSLSTLIHIIFLALEIAFIISLLKKYIWGWKLFLVTNLFIGINVIISNIVMGINTSVIAPFLTLLLMIAISFYVYSKRSYFNR